MERGGRDDGFCGYGGGGGGDFGVYDEDSEELRLRSGEGVRCDGGGTWPYTTLPSVRWRVLDS